MSVTLTTEICNMALSRIGAKRLAYSGTTETDLDANTTLEAIQCNLHYAQTRDSLLRSNWWTFARHTVALVRDTETPVDEFDYQYILPDDYLRPISIYEERYSDEALYSYRVEGTRLKSNDSSVVLRYVRKVTDVAEFDPLFIEVFVLAIAKKLQPQLMGTKSDTFVERLDKDFAKVTSLARVINKQEQNTGGRAEQNTWNDVRATPGGRIA